MFLFSSQFYLFGVKLLLLNETPKNDKKNFSKNFKGKGKNFKNNDKNKRGKEIVLSVEKLAIIKLIVVKIKIITNQIMEVPRI